MIDDLVSKIVEFLEASGKVDWAEQLGNESIRLPTNLEMVLFDEHGNVKEKRNVHNLICTVGKRKLLASASPETMNQFAYIAIGTGTTAASASDTALQTEIARNIATVSNPDADHLQIQYTFPAGTGTGAITEAGIFDASTGGIILAHQVFAVINKGASDPFQMTWTLS